MNKCLDQNKWFLLKVHEVTNHQAKVISVIMNQRWNNYKSGQRPNLYQVKSGYFFNFEGGGGVTPGNVQFLPISLAEKFGVSHIFRNNYSVLWPEKSGQT